LGNPDDLAEEIRQRWYLRDDLHWQPEDAAIAAAYRKARIGGT
jgi:predicted transposase YbfD/YdcC